MIYRKNLSIVRGEAAAFEVPLSFTDGRTLDISAANSVRVDIRGANALAADDPVLSCTEANGGIVKTTTTGAQVAFKWLVTEAQSAALAPGDYRWEEQDIDLGGADSGLTTFSIGGIFTVE